MNDKLLRLLENKNNRFIIAETLRKISKKKNPDKEIQKYISSLLRSEDEIDEIFKRDNLHFND